MERKLPSFLQRYRFFIITGLVLLLWLSIFDRSNLYSQVKMYGDLKSIEKYAREKYFIKKNGETVFLIVDKDNEIVK